MLTGVASQSRLGSPFLAQNSAVKNIVNTINANVGKKQNMDSVNWSKSAKLLLQKGKEKKPLLNFEDTEKVGMFTKSEWAENSLHAQRDGLKTLSNLIDYAKEKLAFTTSKIAELENYISGTGTHSDPDMTPGIAEIYLRHYKESIETDYTAQIEKYLGVCSYFTDQYDAASGGLASNVIENQLRAVTAESLGLTNLSSDPKEIMEALDNASKQVGGMQAKLDHAFAEATGGKAWREEAHDRTFFAVVNNLRYFSSQMERIFTEDELDKAERIVVDLSQFSGEIIDVDFTGLPSYERYLQSLQSAADK